MSTTPPGEQPTGTTTSYGTEGRRPGYGMPGMNLDFARMPMPGNAEFVFLVAAAILLAIIAWIADGLDDNDWWTSFTVLGAAYLLSRGIAKASRVLEQ